MATKPIKPAGPTQPLTDQRHGEQKPTVQQKPTFNTDPKNNPRQVVGGGVTALAKKFQGQPLHMAEPQHIIIGGKDKGVLRGAQDPTQFDPKFPVGYSPDQGPQNTPNYDKLSGAEKWVMNALPGFSQSSVGKALQWFNETPVGKTLQWLDIGAETLERATGFATQALNAYGNEQTWNDFNKDLKAAWYAGSLSADFSAGLNAEVTNYTTDGVSKPELRLYFDSDMPGVDGLVRARQKIVQYVGQGMDYREAMLKAQDEEYNSMGALALRAQMHDLFFHVAADPLNVVMGFLKPVEYLQAQRKFLLSAKIATGVETAGDVLKAEEALSAAADIVKVAGEAGDAEKLAEATSSLSKAQEALEIAQEAATSAEKSKLTAAQRFTLWATGGDPMKAPVQGNALKSLLKGKVGEAVDIASQSKWNPLALTPASRAQEFVNIISTNIQSRLLPAVLKNGEYDVSAFARAIDRAAGGAIGPEFGHMVATLEGQHVQQFLKAVAPEVGLVARAYNAAGDFERPLLKFMGAVLGENAVGIVRQIEEGQHAALFARLSDKLSMLPDAQKAFEALLAKGNIAVEAFNPDVLRASLEMFKGDGLVAADSSLAIAAIGDKVAESAMKQAVLRFGVEQRGLVEGMAHLTKQAQSLAFLKLNPTYPVKNFINNVFTMIGRGAMGTFTPGAIEDFWKLRGFMPTRLLEGATVSGEFALKAADDLEKAAMIEGKLNPFVSGAGKAQEILADAQKFKTGWVNDASQWMGAINKDGWDFGKAAQQIEKLSSEHASTVFYARGENMFGKTGQSWQKIADFNPQLSRDLGPELSKVIENLTEDAKLNPNILDDLVTGDLNVSGSALRSTVEQKMGRPLGGILTDEFMASIQDGLTDAIKSRNSSTIETFFDGVKTKLEQHLDNLNDAALETLTQETLGRVKTEGPGGFVKVWGDAMDEWHGGTIRHDLDTAKLAEEIRNGSNPDLVDAMWKRMQRDGQSYWKRQWDRMEARMGGLTEGAKAAGLKLEGSEVTRNFKSWRKDWQGFFEYRNNTLQEFFDAQLAGKPTAQTWEGITQELDARYQKITMAEETYAQAIDNSVAKLLPDQQRELFLSWRERIRDWKKLDKMGVADFRTKVRQLPAEQIQEAYAAHWQQRVDSIKQIWNEERRGLAALGGNPDAMAAYQESIAGIQQEAQGAFGAFDKKSGGAALGPEEQAQIDQYISRHGSPEESRTIGGLREEAKRIGTIPETDAITKPRGELPEELSSQIDATAKDFKDQLGSGDAPATYKTEEGYKHTNSSNPQWFQDLGVNKKRVYEALDKIIKDKGADKGKLVEKVKEAILAAMKEANPLTGEPPNDAALKFLEGFGSPESVTSLADDLEADVVKRLRGMGEQPPTTPQSFIQDFESIVKPELHTGTGLDQLMYTRGHEAVDAMREEALKMSQKPPLKFGDLDEATQSRLARYFDHVKTGYSDARYASTRFGEFGRDSALLNYNRRYNYNTWLGMVMPYEFWTTQSAAKWALHSIDRPAMLSSYYRIKKFLATAYRPEEGLPSRLRGTVRVPMPFLPDWMQGEMFIDPLKSALPFDSWFGIPEKIQQQQLSDQGVAQRKLQELLNDGKIGQSEYQQALQSQQGPAWERAVTLAQQDDTEERMNGWDFASMMSSPQAPLMWAYNAARGKETGATLPITNTIGSVLGAFGLDPAGPLNPEAAIRKKLGFHPFNEWDDYYTERQLTNMVAEGLISATDARQAMVAHKGDAWDAAYKRTGIERSGGPAGAFLGLLGLPPKAYPEGEEELRQAKDEYEAAWREYDQTGDYASTVEKFNDEHPGYEERLALFKKPEERLRSFLTDELWSKYNELPDLTQRELVEQLGPQFKEAFLSKETRSPESISTNTMAVWLKLMQGGDPYGQLEGQYVPPSELTDPKIAQQAQVFYDSRGQFFPDYRTLGEEYSKVPAGRVNVAPPEIAAMSETYFALPKGTGERSRFLREHNDFKEYLLSDKKFSVSKKQQWLQQHPQYKSYLDWRNNWLLRNPNVAPYVTDKLPKGIEQAQQKAGNQAVPNYTWDEWRGQLGWSLSNLVLDYDRGESLPPVAQEQLSKMANKLGWQGSAEQFAEHIAASQP